jgi:hypothetical protein
MKHINVYRIAKRLGRDPAFIYRIINGGKKCPALLAGAIDTAARAIATEQGLSQDSVLGWRLVDLRPDVIEMVQACLQADH